MVVGIRTTDASFPSGHTASSFAAATAISAFYPKVSPLVFGLAAGVGIFADTPRPSLSERRGRGRLDGHGQRRVPGLAGQGAANDLGAEMVEGSAIAGQAPPTRKTSGATELPNFSTPSKILR